MVGCFRHSTTRLLDIISNASLFNFMNALNLGYHRCSSTKPFLFIFRPTHLTASHTFLDQKSWKSPISSRGDQVLRFNPVYNKAILVGRLGSDPDYVEFKKSDNTNAGYWKFSLCTSKSKMNQISNEWEQDVVWHQISSLKPVGGCTKGSLVLVEGEIKNWKDQNEQFRTQIQAYKVNVLFSKPKDEPEFW